MRLGPCPSWLPGLRAVYTRQSVRTESDLTSCQVQRQLCADFAVGKGFQVVEEQFDDEGYSGREPRLPSVENLRTKSDAAKSTELPSSGSSAIAGKGVAVRRHPRRVSPGRG